MKNQVLHRDVCKIILSLTTALLMLSLTGCGAKRTAGLVSAEGGAEELTAAVGQNATGGDDKITAANAAAVSVASAASLSLFVQAHDMTAARASANAANRFFSMISTPKRGR